MLDKLEVGIVVDDVVKGHEQEVQRQSACQQRFS
jgi:hypothetical protein